MLVKKPEKLRANMKMACRRVLMFDVDATILHEEQQTPYLLALKSMPLAEKGDSGLPFKKHCNCRDADGESHGDCWVPFGSRSPVLVPTHLARTNLECATLISSLRLAPC